MFSQHTNLLLFPRRLFPQDGCAPPAANESSPPSVAPAAGDSPLLGPAAEPLRLPPLIPLASSAVPNQSGQSSGPLTAASSSRPAKFTLTRLSPKEVDPADLEERKTFRAERNRRFAKESRIRKQKYVTGLEKEVTALKKEVAEYKAKLADYELIDKQRKMTGEECCAILTGTFEAMSRRNAAPGEFSQIIMKTLDEMVEERRKALEQLARIMLQVAVPLSLRLFLWEADNDIDIFDPVSVGRAMGYAPDGEEVKTIMASLKATYKDRKTYQDMKLHMAEISQSIRGKVRQFVESQKGIQLETLRIWHYMRKHFLSSYSKDQQTASGLKYVPKLQGRPELSDAAIFRIRDEDFSLDTASVGMDMEDDCVEAAARVAGGTGENNKGSSGPSCAPRKM